jgi:hypothetical protein
MYYIYILKGSKPEEDYDSFIDALMSQLRQHQPMNVIEPSLNQNLTACPLFGMGDVVSQQK